MKNINRLLSVVAVSVAVALSSGTVFAVEEGGGHKSGPAGWAGTTGDVSPSMADNKEKSDGASEVDGDHVHGSHAHAETK